MEKAKQCGVKDCPKERRGRGLYCVRHAREYNDPASLCIVPGCSKSRQNSSIGKYLCAKHNRNFDIPYNQLRIKDEFGRYEKMTVEEFFTGVKSTSIELLKMWIKNDDERFLTNMNKRRHEMQIKNTARRQQLFDDSRFVDIDEAATQLLGLTGGTPMEQQTVTETETETEEIALPVPTPVQHGVVFTHNGTKRCYL